MKISLKLTQVLIYIYTVSILLIPTLGYGRYITAFIIPLSFLCLVVCNLKLVSVLININFVIVTILFLLFSTTSILWALDVDVAVATVLKQAASCICGINFFIISMKDKNNIRPILWAYFSCALLFVLQLYFMGNQIDYNQMRIENEEDMGANTYGYFIMMGLISIFLLGTNFKNKIIINTLLVLFIPLSFYGIILTASRAALIINSIAVITFLYLNYTPNPKYKSSKPFFVIVALTLTIYFSTTYFLNNFYVNSFLEYRMELESKRFYHIQKAIEIGFDNFFTGVGAGNYSVVFKSIEWGSFSHNSYTEAFANFGIIGLSLYIIVQYQIIKLANNVRINNQIRFNIRYSAFVGVLLFQLYSLNYVVYLTPYFQVFIMTLAAMFIHLKVSFKQ